MGDAKKVSTLGLVAILVPYVGLHAGHSLVMKYLNVQGCSLEDILIYRGLGCVLTAVVLGTMYRQSLIPNRPGTQIARFFFSGLALCLITAAFKYANATTVSVISRLDTAILVVVGPWIGVATSRRQQVLAFASLAALTGLSIAGTGGGTEQSLGYVLAFLGTLGITAGYLFLRASARSENIYVVSLIAGLAILFYGSAGKLLGHAPTSAPAALSVGVALLAGVMMFYLYQLTVWLYGMMDITLAEYPTLFAALLVLPAEHYLFGVHFDRVYVISVVANVALLGAVLAMKPGEKSSGG